MADTINELYEEDGFQSIFNLFTSADHDVVKCGGSRPGWAANIDRIRMASGAKLFANEFSQDLTHPDHMFNRRFRVFRPIFVDICSKLGSSYDFFKQRKDAARLKGLDVHQKCTATLRLIS